MSMNHLNAFCLSPDERYIFAGDKGGTLHVVETDSFRTVGRTNAHLGAIQAVVPHPSRPLFAVLSKDRCVSVWREAGDGSIERVFEHNIRDYGPDGSVPFHFESQAIALHPDLDVLATSSGTGSLIELDFSDPSAVAVRTCIRIDPNVHSEFGIATVRYGSAGLLCGEMRTGRITLVRDGSIVEQVTMPECKETLHWFEPVGDGTYLVACDARRILRYSPGEPHKNRGGEVFASDDCEYIAMDRANGRAYASSFDRSIYEIDVKTLAKKRVVHRADFKVRWLHVLKKNPEILIAQVRNGALVKIDVASGTSVAEIKETPDAMWTISQSKSHIFMAGEGSYFFSASALNPAIDRIPSPQWEVTALEDNSNSYSKRSAIKRSSGEVFFGRTNGKVIKYQDGRVSLLAQLPDAVRDLAPAENDDVLYAGLEDNTVVALDASTGRTIRSRTFSQPIWSIAYNEEQQWLACGERNGEMHIIATEDFKTITKHVSRYPKRMRWTDPSTLLISHVSWLDRLAYDNGTWTRQDMFFRQHGNTLEDFDWDRDERYLVSVAYNRRINLFDFKTGRKLDETYNGIDYMKGVAFLRTDAAVDNYGADFMVVGRSGYGQLFRVHEEQIHCLGPTIPPQMQNAYKETIGA